MTIIVKSKIPKMNLIYLQRAVMWIYLLIKTLIKFWAKNPQETHSILNFIFEKITASPRFLYRNVLIENYSKKLVTSLEQTVKLYSSIDYDFSLNNPKSFRKINQHLTNKFQLLYFLIRQIKPTIVVETGVAGGESTSYILQALKDNHNGGRLYSIDLPFQWYIYGNHRLHLDSLPPGKMPGYLVPRHLRSNWKLILGNSYHKLPNLLNKLGKIDIFFHDSEHNDKTMLFEYNTSWPYIKQGGLLLSDDTSYTEAFSQFSKDKKVNKIIFKDLGVIYKNG